VKEKQANHISRRRLFKALIATGGALAASHLPGKWAKPAVEVGVLPAHAQVTDPAVYRINCLSNPASGDITAANDYCLNNVAAELALVSGAGPVAGAQMTLSCSDPTLFNLPGPVATDANGRADFGSLCVSGNFTDGQTFTLNFECEDPVNGGTLSGQCGPYTLVERTSYHINCLSNPASGDISSATQFCITSVASELVLASGSGTVAGVQMTISCSDPTLFNSLPTSVATDANGRADFGSLCITGNITDGQTFTLNFSCTDPVNGGTLTGQCGTYTIVDPAVYRIDCLSVPASGDISAQSDFCIDTVEAQLVLVSGTGPIQGVQMTVSCSDPTLFNSMPATVTTDAQGRADFGFHCISGNFTDGQTFTLDFSCTDPVNGGTLTGQCGTYTIVDPAVYRLDCLSDPSSGGVWCFNSVAAQLILVSGTGPVQGVTIQADTNPYDFYPDFPASAQTDATGRADFSGQFCPGDPAEDPFYINFSCTDPVNGGTLTTQCGPYQIIG